MRDLVDAKGNLHAIWYDNRYLTGNLFWTMAGPADAMNPLLTFDSLALVGQQA